MPRVAWGSRLGVYGPIRKNPKTPLFIRGGERYKEAQFGCVIGEPYTTNPTDEYLHKCYAFLLEGRYCSVPNTLLAGHYSSQPFQAYIASCQCVQL